MTSANDRWTSSSSGYLRAQAGADAWTQEARAAGGVGSQQLLDVRVAEPPPSVAAALDLGRGGAAVERQRLIRFDDRPVELASSWYPAHIAVGTQLSELRKIRGGAVSLLAQLGHRISSVAEDVESRLATPAEAKLLGISERDPVLVLIRTSWNQVDLPVEVIVMVAPGSKRKLRYEMKVD